MEKRYTTGNPHYDLVAAVFRQAIADAKRGDAAALNWLAVVAPDWRTGYEPDSYPHGIVNRLVTSPTGRYINQMSKQVH